MPNVNIAKKILNWYWHIRRREEDNLSRKMMDMIVPWKRRKGGLDGHGSTTPSKISTNMK